MLKRFFLFFGIIYLGLHFWITYKAFVEAGAVAGIATLLTLGLGDLYWAVYALDQVTQRLAIIAAVMAFASWLSRPFTNPYLLRLGLESIDWPAIEDEAGGGDSSNGKISEQRGGAGASAQGPTGGAA